LRCDDNTRTVLRDDITELLKHKSCSIEIHLKDGLRCGLGGGNSGCMNQTQNFAKRQGLFNKGVN